MSEAIAQKLDEARALIEKGWCRGAFNRRGCYCSLGAIAQATTGEPDPDTEAFPINYLYSGSVRYLTAAAHCSSGFIADWNDRQKSKKPVIDAFKRAASLARSEAAAVGGR